MRNFILATLLFASVGVTVLYQRGVLARTRSVSSNLEAQNLSLAASIRHATARIAELEQRRTNAQTELRATKAKLQEIHAEQPTLSISNLNVQREGSWPPSRPYFYLAKKHISNIYYDTFDANGNLTPAAAAIFGMTPAEQLAINQSIDAAFAELQSEELRHAYLTNAPPIAASQPGETKVSVFVPAITTTDSIRTKFAEDIRALLGPERSTLFLDGAQEGLRQFEAFTAKHRTITFIPQDEMSGRIIVVSDGSSMFNFYDFNHTQDFMLTQYGHLLSRFVNINGQ